MNKLFATIFDVIVVVGLAYLVIWYSHAVELIKLMYYRIFRIPYWKESGKFHPIYNRIDK